MAELISLVRRIALFTLPSTDRSLSSVVLLAAEKEENVS